MDDSELERSCFSGRFIIGLFTFVDNLFYKGIDMSNLSLYKVDPDYLEYLHRIHHRCRRPLRFICRWCFCM